MTKRKVAAKMKSVRIGTRGSQLALAQTKIIYDALVALKPGIQLETVIVKTQGDQGIRNQSVGIFTKELENSLATGNIDIAVHSAKDLPSIISDEFTIATVPFREDPRDALISKNGADLTELAPESTVATSSARRKALILNMRPDLKVKSLHGNIPTRLEKLDGEGGPDAIMVAAAGLKRLALDNRISGYMKCSEFISAVGQGALAVEIRKDDHENSDLLMPLQHESTRIEVDAERTFLQTVQGGCSVPVSAHAKVREGYVWLWAFASNIDGTQILRTELHGKASQANDLAIELGQELLDAGAAKLVLSTPLKKIGDH